MQPPIGNAHLHALGNRHQAAVVKQTAGLNLPPGNFMHFLQELWRRPHGTCGFDDEHEFHLNIPPMRPRTIRFSYQKDDPATRRSTLISNKVDWVPALPGLLPIPVDNCVEPPSVQYGWSVATGWTQTVRGGN